MPEVQIFEAVQEWLKTNSIAGTAELNAIVDLLRLPLMTTNELLDIVLQSGFVSQDRIFIAIREKNHSLHCETLGLYFLYTFKESTYLD